MWPTVARSKKKASEMSRPTAAASTPANRKEACDDEEDEGIQDDDDIAPALEEELEHVPYKFTPISAVR